MPTNTAGRGLPVAALGDVPDANVLASQLATALDRVLSIGAGTLATIPAANSTVGTAIGNPFTMYWASDTNQLFLSFGGAWIDLSGASGPPLPIGSSVEYAGSTDPSDSRWLLEDGRALARTGQYAPLFTAISTTFGAGDGTTTFNIPDSRGRVSVGPDNMGTAVGAAGRVVTALHGLGNNGGEERHTNTITEMPSHTHDTVNTGYEVPGTTGVWQFSGFVGGSSPNWVPNAPSGSAFGQTTVTLSKGGSGSHNNMQPYVVKNKIIRVR